MVKMSVQSKMLLIRDDAEGPLSTLDPTFFLKNINNGSRKLVPVFDGLTNGSYLGVPCRGVPLGRVEWEKTKFSSDPHPIGL